MHGVLRWLDSPLGTFRLKIDRLLLSLAAKQRGVHGVLFSLFSRKSSRALMSLFFFVPEEVQGEKGERREKSFAHMTQPPPSLATLDARGHCCIVTPYSHGTRSKLNSCFLPPPPLSPLHYILDFLFHTYDW